MAKFPDTAKTRVETIQIKEDEIRDVLSQHDIDLWKLRELCITEGGLVNDNLRSKAWPKLVGLNSTTETATDNSIEKQDSTREVSSCNSNPSLRGLIDVTDPSLVKSKGFKNQTMAKSLDCDQINRDVTRCTWHLLIGTQRSRRQQIQNKHRKKISSVLRRKQRRLGNFINLVLIQSYGDEGVGKLRYYQGYHDISSIFLSALGGTSLNFTTTTTQEDKENKPLYDEVDIDCPIVAADKTAQAMGLDLPSKVLLKISISHLRDSLKNDFKTLSSALRLFIMPLIEIFDSEVHSHLLECQMEPFFALSWIITWFSHDVRDTAMVKRLFDFFIVSHALMPVYMSIAMVLHPFNRAEILNAECDFASVHNVLSQLPRNSSSVGYKLVENQCDSGYVSDEDDGKFMRVDGTNIIAETNSEDARDDESSNPPSLASASLLTGCDSAPVPFEQLIEMSVEFMRRIPPRRLVALVRESTQSVDVDLCDIALLRPPPAWAIANSVPSDWTLKKRAQEQQRARQRGRVQDNKENERIKNQIVAKQRMGLRFSKAKFTQEISPLAVIATGNGPDGDAEQRRSRRRRKRSQVSALVVAITAVGIMALQDISFMEVIQYLTGDTNLYYQADCKVKLNAMEKEHCVNHHNRIVPFLENNVKSKKQDHKSEHEKWKRYLHSHVQSLIENVQKELANFENIEF